MSGITYADAGVNIELGNDASEILYNAAKETWKNRQGKLGELIVPFDDFSGIRAIDVSNLPENTLMNISFDGVGTKIELAERINNHRTIAYDLFAMVCDDAVVRGAEPVLIGSILDVNSLGKSSETYIEQVKQLAEGYINAAQAANVAIVNGEVAELGARVNGFGSFNYNWGATVVWFANRDRMFTGEKIKVGDKIVGLKEDGFRSNGLSLVRKIMEKHHGNNWHEKEFNGKNLGELALTPSRIYSAAVVDMFGGYDLRRKPKAEIYGVAHITGGGIPEKLRRMLKPSGLGASIEDPFEPSEFMKYTQDLGNVSDEEAYKAWGIRQGMLIATPNPQDVIMVANEHEIEAKEVGEIRKDSNITIKNKGIYASERPYLFF
tara:strand:+ start:671 stop:1804 length:1134 start_codon:yes stop_codon:yes gene_type:complete